MSTQSENRAARIDRLRSAAVRKREEATAKARRAIVSLENRGRAITFASVAREAGVSKDFLYKNSDLRQAIAEKRRPTAVASDLQRTSEGRASKSDTTKLLVAQRALERLRSENAVLRAENALLRGDLHELRRRYGV